MPWTMYRLSAGASKPGIAGLFNTTGKAEVISTKAFAIGLPAGGHYRVTNLWTHRVTSSGTTISANVRPHDVAFYRISPA